MLLLLIENPESQKESRKKNQLDLIRKIIKAATFKINIRQAIDFLYSSSDWLKAEHIHNDKNYKII